MTLKVDGDNGVLEAYDYQVLTTGFSYTFALGTQTLIANPAGTLATGTITMPASPVDGMVITFSSTKEISTLTVSGNTGQSITGASGVLPANTAMSFVYRSANTTWYPMTVSPNGTLCRAWVNFNGTGTVAIRASFNVSSITDNGTGDYTVNFTTALPDANYAAVHPTTLLDGSGITLTVANYARTPNSQVLPTTTAYRFSTMNTSGTAQDLAYCYVSFFR